MNKKVFGSAMSRTLAAGARRVKDGGMNNVPSSCEVIGELTGAAGTSERLIGVDQTNSSVVVDERYVVKWLAVPSPSPMHGIEMRRHLACAGFVEMPRLVGAYERDGRTAAVVTEFVAGALDGWEWLVDDVLSWLAATIDRAAVLESCRGIGALVGRFLSAMAQPSNVWPTSMSMSVTEARWWYERGAVLANEANALEPVLMAAMGDEIERRLQPLSKPAPTAVQWIHGDLHVGQVLRANGQLWLTDFDGDPLDGVPLPHSPVRDVVGLLQSLDHVGRIVNRRTNWQRVADVESWIDDGMAAAHRSLVDVFGPIDEQLVGPLSVMQELHELVYAARHLPRWRYVPEAALPAVLARY
jgi:maltokinase